ncbi:MAG TPA: hypothetical protein VF331_25295 [Polyangiales bacterium]
MTPDGHSRRTTALPAAAPAVTASALPASAMFHPQGPWLGADSAYSIDLGGRRVLWLFADTFLDPAADGSRTNGDNFFIRNSCGIQSGSDESSAYDPARASMSFYWGPSKDAAPSSYFHDFDGAQHWVWPLHGTRLPDGRLLLFRMHVQSVKTGLGFDTVGWDAVAIDDPDRTPDNWTPRLVQPLTAAPRILLGSSVMLHGEYLYAYGVRNSSQDHAVYLARWPLSELRGLKSAALADPQWFCGGAGFRTQSSGVAPAALFPDGQVELSVHYVPQLQRFVELQMRGLFLSDPHTALGLRWADHPEGPWSALTPFFRPPEGQLPNASDLVAYAAKAHPEQRTGSLVVSYVVNDLKHSTPDDALYYPNLVRVDFGR